MSSADVMSSMWFLRQRQRLQMQHYHHYEEHQSRHHIDFASIVADRLTPIPTMSSSGGVELTSSSTTSTNVPDTAMQADRNDDDAASSAPANDFEVYCNGNAPISAVGTRSPSSGRGECFSQMDGATTMTGLDARRQQQRISRHHSHTQQSALGLYSGENSDFAGTLVSDANNSDDPRQNYSRMQQLQDNSPSQDASITNVRPMYVDCSPSDASYPNVCDQSSIIGNGNVGSCDGISGRISATYGRGGANGNRTYHCRMCRKEFEIKTEMLRHAKERHRADEKVHKCSICLKSFPTSQQLMQHNLVHNNIRKYSCRYCDKTFKQLSHVQQHQRIHTGDRPYKCIVETCSKAFRQLSSLQQHLKGHNLPLAKTYCLTEQGSDGISFQAASAAADDVKVETEDKKAGSGFLSSLARPTDLQCQMCEVVCADEEKFYRHIHRFHPDYWRVFSGGRSLADFIGPASVDRGAARGYGGRHTHGRRERKFVCPECAKTFVQESSFLKHVACHKVAASSNYSAKRSTSGCLMTSSYEPIINGFHGKEYRSGRPYIGSFPSTSGADDLVESNSSVKHHHHHRSNAFEMASSSRLDTSTFAKKTSRSFRQTSSVVGESASSEAAATWLSSPYAAVNSDPPSSVGHHYQRQATPGTLDFSYGESNNVSGSVVDSSPSSSTVANQRNNYLHLLSPHSATGSTSPNDAGGSSGRQYLPSGSRYRLTRDDTLNGPSSSLYHKIFEQPPVADHHRNASRDRHHHHHHQRQQLPSQHRDGSNGDLQLRQHRRDRNENCATSSDVQLHSPFAQHSFASHRDESAGLTEYPSATTASPSAFSSAAVRALSAVRCHSQQQTSHRDHTTSKRQQQQQRDQQSMFYRQGLGDMTTSRMMTSPPDAGTGIGLSPSSCVGDPNVAAPFGHRFRALTGAGDNGSPSSVVGEASDHQMPTSHGYLSTPTPPPTSAAYLRQASSSSPALSTGGYHHLYAAGHPSSSAAVPHNNGAPFDLSSELSPSLSGSSPLQLDATTMGHQSPLIDPLNSYLYHQARQRYLNDTYNGDSYRLAYGSAAGSAQHHQQRFGSSRVMLDSNGGSSGGAGASFSGHDVAVASALLARSLPVFR